MWLEKMIKILDINCQTPRLFGEFFKKYNLSIDNLDNVNGKYDVVICHREGIQDVDFAEIKQYCHSNSKIICDITTESGNIQCFLDSFKKTTDNNDYDFYLIVDTDLSKYFNRVDVKYITLQSYSLSFYAFLNKMSDIKMTLETEFSSYENSFMSLNNSCRNHRVLLLNELIKRNLDLTNCSFLMTTASDVGYSYNKKLFENIVTSLIELGLISLTEKNTLLQYELPKQIDFDFKKVGYISNEINEKIYKSILNLVTENLFGISSGDITEDKIVTFTEKVIKPFQARQIPLFLGLLNLQNILRHLGFDLFDDLIDISFENELNHKKRLGMVLDELKRLLQLDLYDFKQKNKNRFEKNYKLLGELRDDGKFLVETFLLENNIFGVEKSKQSIKK